MITVGLPTWNNAKIIWMPLESLCRQETKFEWELIIDECNSFKNVGWDTIKSYWPDLKAAGCVRLLYMLNPRRKALGQKWKDMAMRANGDIFVLQSSDDYTIKERLEITGNEMNGCDWFDFEKFLIYSVISQKMLLFDKNMIDVWKTGGRKAVKTDVLRKLPDNEQKKGVDHFIFYHTCGKIKTNSMVHKSGINTNGLNTISKREHHFTSPSAPFRRTDILIDDLDIPKHVKEKLKNTKPISDLDRLREQKVRVVFREPYKKFPKGHRMTISSLAYFNLIDYVDIAGKELTNYIEHELS